MSDTTTTAAESPAAFAWHMLTRPENTMPLQAGLDWLRTAMDTDDVGAVKRALYAAASDWMSEEFVRDCTLWNSTPAAITNRVRSGTFDLNGINGFSDPVGEMRRVAGLANFLRQEVAARWLPWVERAEQTLSLCRQLEAL